MKRLSMLLLAACLLSGCATKWVPDTDSPLNPPVAFQQQFIVEALDDVFATMDFSRLGGQLVDIEVSGVYIDGDIADYLRSRLQLELAKAGAMSEVNWSDQVPQYKANIMVRTGGVNDLVNSALFFEWRQKQFTYDIQVAVMNIQGGDYFVQSGQGRTEVTISRNFYLLFFPIPLPSEWSTTKGMNFFSQARDTYDAAKRADRNPELLFDRSQIPTGL